MVKDAKAGTGYATSRVIERILFMIMCGELSPGEQIRQEEMAEQCGTSRVPLREALNTLAQQSVLVHKPNVGFFVAKRGPAELAQIRRMLYLLETEVIVSLPWPQQEQLSELKALNQKLRDLIQQDTWAEFAAINRQFHTQILELSEHRLIVNEILHLYRIANQAFSLKYERISVRQNTIEEHDTIINALASRDREALINAIESHRKSNASGLSHAMAGGGHTHLSFTE